MTRVIKNRDVVVLGLGLTGLSAARWAARHGARVRVADTRAEPPFAAQLAAELPHVPLLRGPITDATLADAAMIVISPGLAKDQPPIAAAVARGAELVGDIELFARALRPAQRVLAITGSNGKSTVATLTGELARAAGLSVCRRRQHRRAGSRRACRARAGRALAGRLRHRIVELPTRNDIEPQTHRRDGAQRHRESSRPLCRDRRLRARQGADIRRRGRADPESRRLALAGDAASRPHRADLRRGRSRG